MLDIFVWSLVLILYWISAIVLAVNGASVTLILFFILVNVFVALNITARLIDLYYEVRD